MNVAALQLIRLGGRLCRNAMVIAAAGLVLSTCAASASAVNRAPSGTVKPSGPSGAAKPGQTGAVKPSAQPQPAFVISSGRTDLIRVPRSFFGLSTEYWALPYYLVQPTTFERVLTLLRVRQDGPTVLRIGGDSADFTYWNPGSYQVPPGAYVLTDSWFRSVASLVGTLGLQVIFDLNLERSTPQVSAGLAQAALSYMPSGSIIGFEIGNEPDQYSGYTPADYVQAFQSYAAALPPLPPNIGLLGPASGDAVSGSNYSWARAAISGDRPPLGEATAHRYGLNPCLPRGFPRYPTIQRVLSDQMASAMASPVASLVQYAHSQNLPLRLDEMNSVTCGGLEGVSNTFATALWAPDELFRMLATGLDAVNLHMRPDTINSPFVITPNGLEVRPLLYGLILFARTLQGNTEVLPLRVAATGPGARRLSAWAVLVGHRLRVLLINKTDTSTTASLRLAGAGNATVERLRASGAQATTGVTLDGQQLATDGSWTGTQKIGTAAVSNGQYMLAMPRFSAALVTFRTSSRIGSLNR